MKYFIKEVFILVLIVSTFVILTKKIKTNTNNPKLLRSIAKHMDKCLIGEEKVCSTTTFWIREALLKNEHAIVIANTATNLEHIRNEFENGKIIYIALNAIICDTSCDHHFIISKDKYSDKVFIFQSFASSFTLSEWLNYYFRDHHEHLFTIDEFMELFDSFLRKKDENNFEAMKRLFTLNTEEGLEVAKKCLCRNKLREIKTIKTYDYKGKKLFTKLPKNTPGYYWKTIENHYKKK